MLPAMAQLASPALAVLVWLEHFPNQGRDVLGESTEFAELLADQNICKVGGGGSGDALKLAEWCSVPKNVAIRGLFDVSTAGVANSSLSAECERELSLSLPKKKGHRGDVSRSKREFAHWRSKQLSPLMATYAANDAAVALDIWASRERRDLDSEYSWIEEGEEYFDGKT